MPDLSRYAGFPLEFDPAAFQIATPADIIFERQSRQGQHLQDVLLSPEAVAPDADVYYLFYPKRLPSEAQAVLDGYALTYSLVLLPSLRIGLEFVKTAGHYHPPIAGTALPYPEVYTQLYGTLHLLLQKRNPRDPEQIEDCRLVEMTPGFSITIPPGYAHVLINTTQEPGLMAGLYGRDFKPDYRPVQHKRGLAYYLVADNGSVSIQPNPNYECVPPLHYLTELRATPFDYPDAGRPLWSSFLDSPHRYAFLTQPSEVLRLFGAYYKS
jgi:glucose-6-phosphate isomerase